MAPTARTRSTTPAARPAVALLAAALAITLAACAPDEPAPSAAAPEPTPAATTEPAPAPTAAVDVPIRSTDLASLAPTTGPAPTDVRIPALEVALPVDPVGVQADGQMEIPPLAERAGWYRFGAAPGDPGTAVIAAHVDSVASAGLGPFARLGDVKPGDVVEVTVADGTVRQFAVATVERVPKTDVVWDGVFTRDGAPRLVLITCGGTFQREERRYSDNVIVTADPLVP